MSNNNILLDKNKIIKKWWDVKFVYYFLYEEIVEKMVDDFI